MPGPRPIRALQPAVTEIAGAASCIAYIATQAVGAMILMAAPRTTPRIVTIAK
jgi:hypothetical protein